MGRHKNEGVAECVAFLRESLPGQGRSRLSGPGCPPFTRSGTARPSTREPLLHCCIDRTYTTYVHRGRSIGEKKSQKNGSAIENPTQGIERFVAQTEDRRSDYSLTS
ncbi:hypothetical protein J6590_051771 [Homalodisca vitripennis]|nr:hypothetical protein J6590_051771 [Homalodisca vitripennis]